MSDLTKRSFGRHIRSLRKARGWTQHKLAEKSGIAVDTIRRLELGNFSPSLDTLIKVGIGMNLRLSTIFESCELVTHSERRRELRDLLGSRSSQDLDLACEVLRSIFGNLDARAVSIREMEGVVERDERDGPDN